MEDVALFYSDIEVELETGPDICDITPDLRGIIKASGIRNGSLSATVSGSTGSLTTIEYEDALVRDLKESVDEIIPKERNWAHNATWGDGNGHSHLRASIFGPSLTLPIVNNRIVRGTWRQVVFVDFDNRSRQRKIVVTTMGEK